jgi:hypothetical protein
MAFKKDLDNIFKNSGTNQSKYRFSVKDIYSAVEKLKLHPSHFNTMKTKKGVIRYPGVTRISKMDNVPHRSMSYKPKFKESNFQKKCLSSLFQKQSYMAITSILQTLMGTCLLNTTFKRSNLPLVDILFFLKPFLLEKFKMTSLRKSCIMIT